MIIKLIQSLIKFLESDSMKVQVIMDEDFVKRLDAQAKAHGLSRSAYVNMVMVRHVSQEEVRSEGFQKLLTGEKK